MTERHIGAVFSDIDGTQIAPGNNGQPSPFVSAAAHALRVMDIPLLEVTSRSHTLMRRIVQPLHLEENLCALDGGATIAHAGSGKVEWRKWLSPEATTDTLRAIGNICTSIHFDAESRAQTPHEVLAALDAYELVPAATPSVFAVFHKQQGHTILERLTAIADTHPNYVL